MKKLALLGLGLVATILVFKPRKFLCGLRGHEEFLQLEKDKAYLWCPFCDYRSPGWDDLGKKPKTICAGGKD